MPGGDDHKAFLGYGVKYEFPGNCIVCMAPASDRLDLRVTAPMRLVKTVSMTAVSHEYKYRDIEHVLTITGAPYCKDHVPPRDKQPALDTHGLRFSARRRGGDPDAHDPYIEVDRVVFEFTNADYAARFREANHFSTPGERRRDIAKSVPGVVAELFKGSTWAKARLEQAADKRNARALVKGLSHDNEGVREQALRMLNKAFGHSVAQAAPGAREGIEQLAIDGAGFVRSLALEMLQRFGPSEDSLAIFLDAVDDDYEHARSSAAAALGDYPDVEAIQALIGMIEDESEHVRIRAIDGLGRRGNVGLDKIEKALNDENELVRLTAKRVLGR
ncbi:MAG: HEAT repeat domain-containing protein [Actinomycetota bacterium]